MELKYIENQKIIENKQIKSINLEELKNNLMKSIKNYLLKEEIEMRDIATIDRIEGEYAVCELLDGNMIDIPIQKFNEKISEGDVFDLEINVRNGRKDIIVGKKNLQEMELRRKAILEKLNRIKNQKK